MRSPEDLADGEIVVDARIMTASNATFVARVADVQIVYKPLAGERPLWDFPDGTLAGREVAAYLLSEAFGWDIVPRTWLHEGPFGPGMAQLWCPPEADQEAVTIVPADELPKKGWCHVLDGLDAQDRPVSLVHEDSAALRRMAVFDVVTNNADRKGGHVLTRADGHRHGVDHGLCFHVEHKLRTVLWGWQGRELDAGELHGLRRAREAVRGNLGQSLAELLSGPEVDALLARCDALVSAGRLPGPRPGHPAIPWPPF